MRSIELTNITIKKIAGEKFDKLRASRQEFVDNLVTGRHRYGKMVQ